MLFFSFLEAKEAVEVIEASDVIMSVEVIEAWISSEILPSFRTEAVEDWDIIFNQIQMA